MNDDDAELLRETLRRRASIETRTGLKWNTADTVGSDAGECRILR